MKAKFTGKYNIEYEKLNPAQKDAVDSIDGPVMVVAGPGTGKTQILALRIGKILEETDTESSAILCLTFTNSGVKAMKSRLDDYIPDRASGVKVFTFHSFALEELVEKHYELIGFNIEPKILSDEEAVFLVDEILHSRDWEYIHPRVNPEMYFSELKQLVSILKREQLTPEVFLGSIEQEIKSLKSDPDSISTRGESKGKIKKEVEKKIESLGRTREVVEFYRIYEERKVTLGFMDYDDILEYAVTLVRENEDIRADIYENYQYILIDEHQDSSGVQNNFLKAVWGEVESPNIFVVGDDRQLIYAFSGASLSYFEEFSHIFGKTKLITLVENYRSTTRILALADELLESSMSGDKLKSNTKEGGSVYMSEYAYPRDEIIGAGIYFKDRISEGLPPEECALLVPRNYHVREALSIFRNMGLKVSSGKNISLFDATEAQSIIRILGIIADPYNSVLIAESLLDKTSGIDPLSAHKFLRSTKPDKLTLEELKSSKAEATLFNENNIIAKWGNTLEEFIKDASSKSVLEIVSQVGNKILIDQAKNHEELLESVEVVRSLLHVAMLFGEKKRNITLSEFLEYLKRLESYGSHVALATFGSGTGIQVMTLHKSKGLEYKAVWVAHLNEETLMSTKRSAFTLPLKIKEHIKERDVLSAKRELYVAITRAREDCTLSYASMGHGGNSMDLAQIIRELPDAHFTKKNQAETEKEILSFGPAVYLARSPEIENNNLEELKDFVKENYSSTKISVTLLNNFFECPWKWYFRNFLRLPEIKTKSLALGSAVHGAIEFILKNKSLPSSSAIKEKIQSSLEEEGINSAVELKKLIKDGERAVMRFVDEFYRNLAKDYTPERPVQFRDNKFPHLLMYGKIDLTERAEDGGITITDFKTGSSKTKSVIEKLDEENRLSSHMRQLAMYSYLVAGAEKGKTA